MRILPETIFETADKNLKCNTAYPVFKAPYKKFQSRLDIMSGIEDLSFYIHVPFCKTLCKFCEYTRFLAGNQETENHYMDLIEKQIEKYINSHPVNRIFGLDIGGGTPTALSENNFDRLLSLSDILESGREKADNYEKSIEFSFSTISDKKLRMIYDHGFRRISGGIQSMSHRLMTENNREFSELSRIMDICSAAHDIGIEKINLDFMYGMDHQDDDMLKGAVAAVEMLRPDQVTLYEMRFNRMKSVSTSVTRDLQFRQYSYLYKALTGMGYNSRFGKNTFSLGSDPGVSSYLFYRMDQCIPYKGFGISAQSMSPKGLSYGSLKNNGSVEMPDIHEISEESNYMLPENEIAAKYVSIALYSGEFRLDILERILGADPELYYSEELAFLRKKGLIDQDGSRIMLTPEGFRYYGAVAVLFWSEEQKTCLLQDHKNSQLNGKDMK